MTKLKYDRPAGKDWNRALPVGCGTLGAMIFGNPLEEHMQLNEDSVWSGGPANRINPDAAKNLQTVRRCLEAGRIYEAQELLRFAFSGTPQSERCYQTLGDMSISMLQEGEPREYVRELDLETAVHRVAYSLGGRRYVRETFATAVRNCIVTRIVPEDGGSVSAAVRICRPGFCRESIREDGAVFFTGLLDENYTFCAGAAMAAKNARVTTIGEHLVARDAKEILVFFTAATTFRHEDEEAYVRRMLAEAAGMSWERLREEHIRDYRTYFDRVRLHLASEEERNGLPADRRLSDAAEGKEDPGLVKLYFDFGRYLLISSSRPGSLPANLQGIWNRDYSPAWGSKYTININTEMNYWCAEMLGMEEMHLPLFELLERMAENGERTAAEMYGCRGFVAHHNTDLWADTAPQDVYTPATVWPMGGAWLCTHVWRHYDYTGDLAFLRRMYPVVRKCALFFIDYLIRYQGYYVTSPSVSPENTYILPDQTHGCACFGPAMDSQILRDLFTQVLAEAELVGEEDGEFLAEVRERLLGLRENTVGSRGQLLEWFEEYGEAEPGHRHISHLYALHPSDQIRKGRDRALAAAAGVTLQERLAHGGGHTGWSRAWIMNLYARLWDGEACWQNFMELLRHSTLPNLLDSHPPFQIDGNFGAISAVGEMLLQSFEREVLLLPALPETWHTGFIEGIRARGGASYDIYWQDNSLIRVCIRAERAYRAEVFYKGVRKTAVCPAKGSLTFLGKDFYKE